MLHWLVPLFFFGVLMGSPVPGFLAFMLIGLWHAWQSWRQPHSNVAFRWTIEDTWLALCFMSIPMFKALSALWSEAPVLAFRNALWHLYFFFWPLVLLGLAKCRTNQQTADDALASGLVFVACWQLAYAITDASWLHPGNANPGILAQLAMTVGVWNMLALTRPGVSKPSNKRRGLYATAVVATFVILVLSTRRLELLGFAAMAMLVVVYRLRKQITFGKALILALAAMLLVGLVVYLRWEKFALGFEQIAQYRIHGANTPDFTVNSWGIRLELWRVSLAAFLDHPVLGISASARPFNMQAWGAPPPELFMHRHFHSHLLQTLVEGGLLGLLILFLTLAKSIQVMIAKPWKTQSESALMAAGLLVAYIVEGSVSATLQYDKANALLVVLSCWVWLQVRAITDQAKR